MIFKYSKMLGYTFYGWEVKCYSIDLLPTLVIVTKNIFGKSSLLKNVIYTKCYMAKTDHSLYNVV